MSKQYTYHGGCVLKSAVTAAASTGTASVAMVFQVPDVGERTVWLYLSDGAMPYTTEKLEACGFNGDFADPKFDQRLYDEGIQLSSHTEDYDGTPKEKWDIARERKPITPAASDLVKKLSREWKMRNGTTSTAGKPPASKPSSPPSAPPASPSKSPPKSPPPSKDVWDTNRAWDVFAVLENAEAAWHDAIDAVMVSSNKPRDKFTSAEWKAVADIGGAGIPV